MSGGSKNSTGSGAGVGFAGLLAVAFVVLKLCKVIDWSWWWVLSPIWIPVCFVLSAITVFLIFSKRR